MPSMDLHPRSGSEIVDAAFQLYRRDFGPLITLTAAAFLPMFLLSPFVMVEPDLETFGAAQLLGSLLLIAAGWVFGSLAEAGVVLAVSNSYLGGDPDVPGALRRTLARLGTVVAASVLKWLIIGVTVGSAAMVGALVGSSALFAALITLGNPIAAAIGSLVVVLALVLFSLVAGAHLYARLFAVSPAVMLEGMGVFAALRRSNRLSKGLRRKIALVMGLPLLIIIVLNAVAGAILELLPVPSAAVALGQQAVNVLTYPILAVIATLLYYDVRVRREGLDVELLAAQLDAAGSGTGAAPGEPRVGPAATAPERAEPEHPVHPGAGSARPGGEA